MHILKHTHRLWIARATTIFGFQSIQYIWWYTTSQRARLKLGDKLRPCGLVRCGLSQFPMSCLAIGGTVRPFDQRMRKGLFKSTSGCLDRVRFPLSRCSMIQPSPLSKWARRSSPRDLLPCTHARPRSGLCSLVRTAGLGQGVPGVVLELVACVYHVSYRARNAVSLVLLRDILFIEAFCAALIP